jgi:hypothetical protein
MEELVRPHLQRGYRVLILAGNDHAHHVEQLKAALLDGIPTVVMIDGTDHINDIGQLAVASIAYPEHIEQPFISRKHGAAIRAQRIHANKKQTKL